MVEGEMINVNNILELVVKMKCSLRVIKLIVIEVALALVGGRSERSSLPGSIRNKIIRNKIIRNKIISLVCMRDEQSSSPVV